jgi:hypothetical protein
MYDDSARLREVDDEAALPIFEAELTRLGKLLSVPAISSKDVADVVLRLRERVSGTNIIRDSKSKWGRYNIIDRFDRWCDRIDDRYLVASKIDLARNRLMGGVSSPGGTMIIMDDLASVADHYKGPQIEEATTSDRAASLARTVLARLEEYVKAGRIDEAESLRDNLFALKGSDFSLNALTPFTIDALQKRSPNGSVSNEPIFTAQQNRNYPSRLWLFEFLEPIANGLALGDVEKVVNAFAFMDQPLSRKSISKPR